MRELVFAVQAYEDSVASQLNNVVVVEIFAKSEKEAISRAKSLIKREHYRVSNIIEKDTK